MDLNFNDFVKQLDKSYIEYNNLSATIKSHAEKANKICEETYDDIEPIGDLKLLRSKLESLCNLRQETWKQTADTKESLKIKQSELHLKIKNLKDDIHKLQEEKEKFKYDEDYPLILKLMKSINS